MPLIPFSKKHPGEFLDRTEDNFTTLLEKIKLFHNETKGDIQERSASRRKLNSRFSYQEELKNIRINQKGISTDEVILEFNDMLSGCIRHQDPTAAFNIIPSPLFDSVAALTIASLYNSNPCWDFIYGKLCLYEKKIVGMLGDLVGWPHADGFVVTGGKQAIAYAIRCGIGRAGGKNPQKMDEYVVFCSATAHFSIEHVCNYLGINSENCIRVATCPTGEIDLEIFKKKLDHAISQGKKVAAVIAVAGVTINLVPDPIFSIKKIIDEVVKTNQLNYAPYLHVDSVITWTWLAFKDNLSDLSNSGAHPNVQEKIRSVFSKISAIEYADSFAADFHKTGFCPYAAGVYITKDSANLLGITSNGYCPPEDPFGELEPLRQTFENSRSSLPIVSIWIAIRRMGLDGLRQFVIYQLEVCEVFKRKIRENYNNHFEILNENSRGWEIVLKPHFNPKISWDRLQNSSDEEQQNYIRDCYALINEFWYAPFEETTLRYPIIGFIPKYSRTDIHEKVFQPS